MNKRSTAVSYLGLRQAIGYIGLLMPIVVMIVARLSDGISLDSVSAAYYTDGRDIFAGSLAAVGTFLLFYVDTAGIDRVLAKIAGAAGVGIGLLPMDLAYEKNFPPDRIAELKMCVHGPLGYHIFVVATFFAIISYMVLFRFTKRDALNDTPQKDKRNIVYVTAGIVMLLSFAVIGVSKLMDPKGSIFWPETFAIAAFSVAWLVKGQIVLKDPA